MGALDWRDCNVGSRRHEVSMGKGGAGSSGLSDPYLANGRHSWWSGGLDWRVPDFVGRISWNVAVDVHDRSGATGGNVAEGGAGVFLLPVDADDGARNPLHVVQVALWKR